MKLFKEFKEFISKGSVLDLAVGMIIGSAFTAIVSAVVGNIFTPLINLIPVNETGLITVLREAVVDENGNIITAALVIDWGAVISAIITFFITALILFAIVKGINSAKREAGKLKTETANLVQKRTKKDAAAEQETVEAENIELLETAPEVKDSAELADSVTEAVEMIADSTDNTETMSEQIAQPTTDELLKEIIQLLKNK